MQLDQRKTFLLATIVMSSSGLLATDIYLPALPEMTRYFNCNQSEIQSTFIIFLLGLAVCQLIYGVLSDRFGQKRIAILGLVLFTIMSILCAHSITLTQFSVFRLLQAIGGGAGSVVSRVMITNRYNKTESVQIFSTIFPIIGLSAAVGPFIGGYLTYFFNWQATFYFMAGYGLLGLMLVLFCLGDSSNHNRANCMPFDAKASYRDVLKNLPFLGYACIICAGFCVFRAYTVESPFVFYKQGFLVEELGTFYVALSIAYIAGNLIAKRYIEILSLEKLIKLGLLFSLLGGLGMVVFAHHFEQNPLSVILPMSVITLGNGLLFPTSSAAAMNAVPHQHKGLASGMVGTLQFIAAALCIYGVGQCCHGKALTMALFIFGIIVMNLLSFCILSFWGRAKTQKLVEFTSSGL